MENISGIPLLPQVGGDYRVGNKVQVSPADHQSLIQFKHLIYVCSISEDPYIPVFLKQLSVWIPLSWHCRHKGLKRERP